MEICARLCQLTCLFLQDHSLLSTDVKNAFNTLRRGEIYAGVQEHAPGLLGFFHSFYSVEAELRNSRGELVGSSATGVRQGDPLGGLFYCCGAQRTWMELHTRFQSLRTNQDVALVWGYHDDFHFYGSNTAIEEFLDTLDAEELKERGFCFVREKTIAVGPFASSLAGIRTSEDGHKFVGVHCGTDDYVGASIAALLQQYARSLPALLHLDAQTALILIAQCINKRPGYLSRVWEQGANFLSYDFDISHCILKIACGGNYQYSNESVNLITSVRSLPELQGGLNIEAYHSGIRRAQVSWHLELWFRTSSRSTCLGWWVYNVSWKNGPQWFHGWKQNSHPILLIRNDSLTNPNHTRYALKHLPSSRNRAARL